MVSPTSRKPGKQAAPSRLGEVRIIGGRLRGSKLPVLAGDGLRPSADRVRETLFNWLQHEVAGSRVIDLFAGSGALGLEAASRGAAGVVLVERDPRLAQSLQQQVARLGVAAEVSVHSADGLQQILPPAWSNADLLFCDPPFAAELWSRLPAVVERLQPEGGWVYLEAPRERVVPLPADWVLYREGSTRDVRFALYRRSPAPR